MRFKGLKWPLLLSSIAWSMAVCLAGCLTVCPAFAAEKPTFQAKPPDQYPNKQATDGVTMAS